jgi:DNA-binding MarR family transcriptional regulator
MEITKEHSCSPRAMKAYLDRVTGPRFEELGITTASAPFLAEIAHNEGISLKGLTDLVMVDKAHTTRVVSKLIESGLVENRAQGHEYSLYLTEEGTVKAERAMEIIGDAWKSMFRDLTPEEVDALNIILQKVSNVIKEASV